MLADRVILIFEGNEGQKLQKLKILAEIWPMLTLTLAALFRFLEQSATRRAGLLESLRRRVSKVAKFFVQFEVHGCIGAIILDYS